MPDPLVADKGKDHTTEHEDDNNMRKFSLKSSLKKPSNRIPPLVEEANQHDAVGEKGGDHTERRKVQWTDVCGSELAEIREFEPRYVKEYGFDVSFTCVLLCVS